MPASDYLSEGVQEAAIAREMTEADWNDIWKNYASQYALSNYEFDRNLEMWRLNNAYNSPSAQMARYKEAGLNPNFVYQSLDPGNSTSMPQYHRPDVKINPRQEERNEVDQVLDVIGLVANAAGSLSNIIDQSLNVQLKMNEVKQSNLDWAISSHVFPGENGQLGLNMANLQDKINPLSSNFDPMAFIYFQKNGQLPQFWNNYLNSVSSRQLQDYKSNYQQYVNENLLPKFDEYQKGKIDIQELEKELLQYQKSSIEMIPPELRGILEPLFDYLGPMFKVIFKRVSTH